MALRSSVKWVILVLLTQLVGATVNPVYGAGYGEDSEALGQFVDDFTDLGNVSIAVDVVHNSTYDAMELNYSSGVSATWEPQNYTTFTEVDTPAVLTVNADNEIQWLNMDRDITSYIYKDFGVAGFDGDWSFNFSSYMIHDTDRGSAYVFGLTNVTGNDLRTLIVAGNEIVNCRWFDIVGSALHRFSMEFYLDGALQGDANRNYDSMTNYVEYWFVVSKTGLSLNCSIYSDSGFSVLVGDIWNDLDKEYNFRYLYAVSSHNSASSGQNSDGKVFDLSYYNESVWTGYAPNGYLTTTDYMADPLANGSALVLMTSSLIPAGTSIKVQISNDNATWGDAEGTPGDSNVLESGLFSIDLRYRNESGALYLNYTLSTTNGALTPWLNQSRVITTIGAGVSTTVEGVNWLPIALILGLAMVLLTSKVKK